MVTSIKMGWISVIICVSFGYTLQRKARPLYEDFLAQCRDGVSCGSFEH